MLACPMATFLTLRSSSGAADPIGADDGLVAGETEYGFTPLQLRILLGTSLAVSAVSVLSAMVAFYWFVCMRRNFRHDLIMLLIQSDMFKSLFTLVFPLASFVRGPISSTSPVCQAFGFLLSVGIEASDLAVLMIALHTGFNIFRPRHGSGEFGLFPYRHVAFFCWAFLPLALAAIAFLNRPLGYVSDGRMCYLPGTPEWPRLVLSWVPRYIIFATILLTYGFIYYHVSLLIRRFGLVASNNGAAGPPPAERTFAPLPMPPIKYHGLIPSSPASSRRSSNNDAAATRRLTISDFRPSPSAQNLDLPLTRSGYASQFNRTSGWKWSDLSLVPSRLVSPSPPRELLHAWSDINLTPPEPDPDHKPVSPLICVPPTSYPPPALHRRQSASANEPPETVTSPSSSRIFWNRAVSIPDKLCARPSLSNRVTLLWILGRGPRKRNHSNHHRDHHHIRRWNHSRQHHNSLTGHLSSSSSSLSTIFLTPSALNQSGLARTRDRVRRHLRLLFVYPLVYMLMWVAPFVAHIFKWDHATDSAPFGVALLSTASLCAQGAVNAWLFSRREKPWRNGTGALRPTDSKSGGGETGGRLGFGCWDGVKDAIASSIGRARGGHGTGPGRTREEMFIDSRIARRRRRGEEVEEQARLSSGSSQTRKATLTTTREWWDAEPMVVGDGGWRDVNWNDDEDILDLEAVMLRSEDETSDDQD